MATEAGVEPRLAAQLVRLGNAIRRLENHDLEEVASTRLLIFAARMIKAGLPVKQACMTCLAEPLSDDLQTVQALMDDRCPLQRRLIPLRQASPKHWGSGHVDLYLGRTSCAFRCLSSRSALPNGSSPNCLSKDAHNWTAQPAGP